MKRVVRMSAFDKNASILLVLILWHYINSTLTDITIMPSVNIKLFKKV